MWVALATFSYCFAHMVAAINWGLQWGAWFGLVYWGLTPQQQPGSYQGGEMMMRSVFWWRKPEYPEESVGRCTVGRCIGLHV